MSYWEIAWKVFVVLWLAGLTWYCIVHTMMLGELEDADYRLAYEITRVESKVDTKDCE